MVNKEALFLSKRVSVSGMRVLALLLAVLCLPREGGSSDRPVIGVLAQETKPWDPNSKLYKSYISASYVKAVEASGARVVPVFVDKDEGYYRDMASKINGFVFPGGSSNVTSTTGYARSARIVFDVVSDMSVDGVDVPILGVCLGMELLATITLGKDARTPCSVKNEALKLDFLPGFRQSSLYRHVSQWDLDTLSTYKSTSNHHRYCVTQKTLSERKEDQWRVLSTSRGAHSGVFVSSMEMRRQPVVALIFHPEKNAYEWKSDQANPHDARSIAAARVFYDWLVARARNNSNVYRKAADLMNDLIYNYQTVFTGKQGLYDFQNYYFP